LAAAIINKHILLTIN